MKMVHYQIDTQRLLIRSFNPNDAADLHEIFGDPETMRNCEPAYGFEKTKSFLENFCICRNGALAAVEKKSRKVIGYILFNECEEGIYEIGWIFNKAYWRKGYAYESCCAVIDHAFLSLNAHKIFAEAIDPVKSVSLMKKLGMCCEGIQKEQTKNLDGNWADLYFYGLLYDEWKEKAL